MEIAGSSSCPVVNSLARRRRKRCLPLARANNKIIIDLGLKALLGAAAIVAIGYFGKNSANAWAAVIIQIPIITVFGLWAVAGSGGNEAMGAVARAAFFSAPIFWSFIAVVYLLRETTWPPLLVLGAAGIGWLLATILWLKIFSSRL